MNVYIGIQAKSCIVNLIHRKRSPFPKGEGIGGRQIAAPTRGWYVSYGAGFPPHTSSPLGKGKTTDEGKFHRWCFLIHIGFLLDDIDGAVLDLIKQHRDILADNAHHCKQNGKHKAQHHDNGGIAAGCAVDQLVDNGIQH